MGETSPRSRRAESLKEKPVRANARGGAAYITEIRGEELHLYPDHALYWPRRKMLSLSDVHLGKAESLQGLGLPVPSGSHLADFGRIAALLRATQAERVLILGDLIHAKRGLTDEILESLQKFLQFFSGVSFELLAGNHERGALQRLSDLKMRVQTGDRIEGPFRFSHGHDPDENAAVAPSGDLLNIQGHVHPVTVIREGPTRLRLPCFWLTPTTLTLPAFGSLTGGWVVKPGRRDRVFATTGEQILAL